MNLKLLFYTFWRFKMASVAKELCSLPIFQQKNKQTFGFETSKNNLYTTYILLFNPNIIDCETIDIQNNGEHKINVFKLLLLDTLNLLINFV